MNKEEIIDSIIKGENEYFGYEHFDSSNMADYTINEVEAADIIATLTH